MDMEEIEKLVRILEGSTLSKLVWEKKGETIHLEKGGMSPPIMMHHPAVAPPVAAAVTSSPAAEAPLPGTYVTSPMVGTFYSAPAPDKPPFIKVGDKVEKGTVVCIIEAMKVLNEVKAGVSGTVAEVLVQPGQPVEFGMKLFRVV